MLPALAASYVRHLTHWQTGAVLAIGVLAAVTVGTACVLPGSVCQGVARMPAGNPKTVSVEHPTGEFSVELGLDAAQPQNVTRAALLRTARLLMRGETEPVEHPTYGAVGDIVVGGLPVGLQSQIAQFTGALRADQIDDAVEGDVLIVCPEFGLGRRGEERLVELARLDQTGGQVDTADRSGVLIVEQSGAGEIAAGHALHRHHVESPNNQRAAQHLGRDARVIGRAGQMIGRVHQIEEEDTHRRQDAALIRNFGAENEVEGRDPVGRDEQQVLVIDAIELADLAAGQVTVIGQGRTHRDSLSALGGPAVLGSKT